MAEDLPACGERWIYSSFSSACVCSFCFLYETVLISAYEFSFTLLIFLILLVGEEMNSCMRLDCWLELNHDTQGVKIPIQPLSFGLEKWKNYLEDTEVNKCCIGLGFDPIYPGFSVVFLLIFKIYSLLHWHQNSDTVCVTKLEAHISLLICHWVLYPIKASLVT